MCTCGDSDWGPSMPANKLAAIDYGFLWDDDGQPVRQFIIDCSAFTWVVVDGDWVPLMRVQMTLSAARKSAIGTVAVFFALPSTNSIGQGIHGTHSLRGSKVAESKPCLRYNGLIDKNGHQTLGTSCCAGWMSGLPFQMKLHHIDRMAGHCPCGVAVECADPANN